MKLFTVVLATIVVVALAYNLGTRIPADTVALAIGVVVGALGSIPFSLLIGAVLGKREQSAVLQTEEVTRMAAHQPPYPRTDSYGSVRDYSPLVIINPASFQNARQPAYAATGMQSVLLPGAPREFRVVGEEAT
jgi:hypothetical protein